MCAQFQRNRTCLVALVSGHVSAAQTTERKKMKAGGSQLPAAVFVFICNLFFVPRHQSTDIQVRVRFLIVIWLIRIHTHSRFEKRCIGVLGYCFLQPFLNIS